MDNTSSEVMQVTTASAQTIAALIQLLDSITRAARNNRELAGGISEMERRAIDILIEHIKRGGRLISDSIHPDEAELFSRMLRESLIPFLAVTIKDAISNEDRVLYMTRDSDERTLNDIRYRYIKALNEALARVSQENELELEADISR